MSHFRHGSVYVNFERTNRNADVWSTRGHAQIIVVRFRPPVWTWVGLFILKKYLQPVYLLGIKGVTIITYGMLHTQFGTPYHCVPKC